MIYAHPPQEHCRKALYHHLDLRGFDLAGLQARDLGRFISLSVALRSNPQLGLLVQRTTALPISLFLSRRPGDSASLLLPNVRRVEQLSWPPLKPLAGHPLGPLLALKTLSICLKDDCATVPLSLLFDLDRLLHFGLSTRHQIDPSCLDELSDGLEELVLSRQLARPLDLEGLSTRWARFTSLKTLQLDNFPRNVQIPPLQLLCT